MGGLREDGVISEEGEAASCVVPGYDMLFKVIPVGGESFRDAEDRTRLETEGILGVKVSVWRAEEGFLLACPTPAERRAILDIRERRSVGGLAVESAVDSDLSLADLRLALADSFRVAGR